MRGKGIIRTATVAGVLGLGLICMAKGDDKAVPGPIDSLQDLESTGRMLFKLADTNNDNFISQKEATDAGNLLVGGFFFRADANGDGKLSAEEVQTARENLFNQRPLLRFVFERASDQTGENIAAGATKHPLWKLTTFLDTNNDGELSSAELRQAVASAVQTLYLTADANRDSQLDPAEINRAVLEVGRSAAQAAFNASDADRNGAISQEEFDKAIMVPAHVAFRILDANRDKQLSADELRSAADI